MALQLRRGTNAQRLAVTPLEGEIIVVTDYAAADVNPLWLGDGATVGGVVPIQLALDDLTDVVIAELVDKQILQYNTATQQWNNISNPVFSGLTAGNITVGLTDDNTIATTTGNLTIDAAGGAVTINDPLTVNGSITNNGQLNTNTTLVDIYNNTSVLSLRMGLSADAVSMGNASSTTNVRGSLLVNNTMSVNNGVLFVNGVLDRVGVNNSNPQFPLDVNGDTNIQGNSTVSGDSIVGGAVRINGNRIQNSTGTDTITMGGDTGLNVNIAGDLRVSGDVIRKSGGAEVISFSGTNLTTLAGDLSVLGGDITTTAAIGNLFNNNGVPVVNIGYGATTEVNLGNDFLGRVQIKSPLLQVNGEAVIAGNLTVNGDLTYLNVADLQVEDKNIILARGNTTNLTADTGGITLKGTTDKTISWLNQNGRWHFNNGDGVNNVMVMDIDDLRNVQTSTFSDGDFLVAKTLSPGNIQFVNSSLVEFTGTESRPKFINNAGGASAAEFLKRVSTAADGDTSAVLFGSINSVNNGRLYSQRISSEYDAAGNNILRVQSDPVGQFATGSTTIRTQLTVSDTALATTSGNIILNASHVGTPVSDAAITVERGSGTDATLSWNESIDTWIVSNSLLSPNIVATATIGTNGGEFFFNNDDGTPSSSDNASIIVRRGAGGDMVFRWNEGTDRWESTTDSVNYIALPNQALDTGNNPVFAGATLGNVRVGITGDNEIDTAAGNLTIDSAGGTTTVDDNLVVSGAARFDSTVELGNSVLDTVTVNGSTTFTSPSITTFNGSLVANNQVTLGNDSGDALAINSSVTTDIRFSNQTNAPRGIRGTIGNNDAWFVGGFASADSTGELIIATADDGTEPIYVRQYTGNILSGTIAREVTLLNAGGNSIFPGTMQVKDGLTVTGTGYIYSSTDLAMQLVGNDATVFGDLTLNGDVIRKSSGTPVIEFSGTNLTTIKGDLVVEGNTIRSLGNTAALELTGADVTAQGNLTVAGNLTVNGTTTTINSTTLDVEDINITIAKGAVNAAAANGAGITVDGAGATITYTSADNSWNLNRATNVAGAFTANTVGSQAQFLQDTAGDEIAATIARTVVATGETGAVTIASTNRLAMKVMVVARINSNSNTHVIEALVMRDSSSASGAQVTFYGELKTQNLAIFAADYDSDSNTIRLTAEATGIAAAPAIYPPWPDAGVTFKVVRTALF